MCGIIGYVGHRPAIPVIIEGLRHLEYRGYDSAGIGFIQGRTLYHVKAKGKLNALEEKLSTYSTMLSTVGIGHTRWATHGSPSERNAHPHINEEYGIAIVHNGIIENFHELKHNLSKKQYQFNSDTDTEVLTHLIVEGCKQHSSLIESFAWALRQAKGTYAVALISKNNPSTILAARMSAPLVLGVGTGEYFVASDIPSFLHYTHEVVFLEDNEIVSITNNSWQVSDLFTLSSVGKTSTTICWNKQSAQKNGYKHFMLKEIFEQPHVIKECLSERINQGTNQIYFPELDNLPIPTRLTVVACGSSYHAGIWGKTILESWAKIPTLPAIASEFRYQELITSPGELVVVISQSGETADTLAALRLAKEKGCKVIALCNVIGSTIAREADAIIYTQAGPEFSVASTKAVCSQMILIALITLYYSQQKKTLTTQLQQTILSDLKNLSQIIQQSLPTIQNTAKQLAKCYASSSSFFFLGRGEAYSLALEGALKLKELSYIHAEGYASGEMKHGPIALIDKNFPTVVIALYDKLFSKSQSNIAEIQARNGPVIILTNAPLSPDKYDVNHLWTIPNAGVFTGFIILSALQLFSYEMAGYLGKDVDQPRNLAKSVTVE